MNSTRDMFRGISISAFLHVGVAFGLFASASSETQSEQPSKPMRVELILPPSPPAGGSEPSRPTPPVLPRPPSTPVRSAPPRPTPEPKRPEPMRLAEASSQIGSHSEFELPAMGPASAPSFAAIVRTDGMGRGMTGGSGDSVQASVEARIAQVASFMVSSPREQRPQEAIVLFTVDGRGYVETVSIAQSSNVRRIDEQIPAILHLAEPFPAQDRSFRVRLPFGR